MKLSSHHKQLGDSVEFVDYEKEYDKVYISKVFTDTPESDRKIQSSEIVRGGSGYDLKNKLPYNVEHAYPDYALYPQHEFATGFLTRGCPRCNHSFCITPEKDGKCSLKVADLSEFWNGQPEIKLLDQNLLACREHMGLLKQLVDSKALVDFTGGTDARFVNEQNVGLLNKIKVKMHHFAWDDPKEDLRKQFQMVRKHIKTDKRNTTVYVLTNFWSTTEEDLMRIYWLRDNDFTPYVMVYDRQKYVDSRGRWLPSAPYNFTEEQLTHFKACQDLQRWCNSRYIFRSCDRFEDYWCKTNNNRKGRGKC